MIHIVFNEEDVAVLKTAIALDETLAGDVVFLADDYAAGPLANANTIAGANERAQWWQMLANNAPVDDAVSDGATPDLQTAAGLVGQMRRDEEEQIWIWAAQNAHDVSGYYWLLHFMAAFQERVFILYLNNLPFINEKGGIFYPQWLHQIPAKEFLKARKLARPITPAEFEVDSSEWEKLTAADLHIRVLEGGKKLAQHQIDFFDNDLRQLVTADWQKASKVLQHFLVKSKQTVNPKFLLWRLTTLAQLEQIDIQSKTPNAKEFEVKTK